MQHFTACTQHKEKQPPQTGIGPKLKLSFPNEITTFMLRVLLHAQCPLSLARMLCQDSTTTPGPLAFHPGAKAKPRAKALQGGREGSAGDKTDSGSRCLPYNVPVIDRNFAAFSSFSITTIGLACYVVSTSATFSSSQHSIPI